MLIPFVISFIVGTYYFVKTKGKLNNASNTFNAIAGTLLAVILISTVTYNIEDIDSFENILITTNTSLATDDTTIETIPPNKGKIKSLPGCFITLF